MFEGVYVHDLKLSLSGIGVTHSSTHVQYSGDMSTQPQKGKSTNLPDPSFALQFHVSIPVEQGPEVDLSQSQSQTSGMTEKKKSISLVLLFF